MKRSVVHTLSLALLGLGVGCGGDSSGDTDDSSAGASGQAGAQAAGKAGASGGSAGMSGSSGHSAGSAGLAGSSGKGGTPGAGGTSSVGGSTGAGGSTSAGGTSSTGGMPGTGGASGTDGAPVTGGTSSTGGAPGAGGAPSTGAGGDPTAGGAGEPTTGTGGASDTAGAGGGPVVVPTFVERASLTPADVAVLVNTDDPQSVAVGEYYRAARGIPAENVVELALGAGLGTNLDATTFSEWKKMIDAAVSPAIQAYAVSWTQPSVVDGMALTSALAFGYDKKWTNSSGQVCDVTAESPYFNTATTTPWTTLGVRPAMVLAGTSVDNVKALIDRGVSADGTFPTGDGWMITTTDPARSARSFEFQQAITSWPDPGVLKLTHLDNSSGMASDYIENQTDVLFYFTGLIGVPQITTNTYRPGAIADHLTSFGGQIPDSYQMSSLRWLEAGVTGSFGTVVEPCAFTTKFPDPNVVLSHYYRGESLLESYWKSVEWPGEGLFIGEPLARPWGTKTSFVDTTLTITTTTLLPGKTYALESAPSLDGPWTAVQENLSVTSPRVTTLTVANVTAPYYRLSTP